MKQLYIRIYLTVLTVLALFALGSGWLVQQHLDESRQRAEGMLRERSAAWGELLLQSLPPATAPEAAQAAALRDWSQRLRLPMALDDAQGRRVVSSDSFVRRGLDPGGPGGQAQAIRFSDGRTLWVLRPGSRIGPRAGGRPPDGRGDLGAPPPWWGLWTLRGHVSDGVGLIVLLLVLFVAVAAGAWPVVRRLTRRLEDLKSGVESFGAGNLRQRVAVDGADEVSQLAASFNRTATRIEALVQSHQSLLANASHELRSPLARLKMAVSMLDDAPGDESPAARAALRREISTNIGELDALVDEVLLASRLDGAEDMGRIEDVDLQGLLVEEAARLQATLAGSEPLHVQGVERLLRRAVRNLMENARRYGGDEVEVSLQSRSGQAELRVCDRGPGVPEALRERIFEPFFRLPGHAEREGGVGLGLALVRQIAQKHDGQVRCEPRDGGGSCFTLRLPFTTD